MGVLDLAVVPTRRGSSLAEDPGSSLDVAGKADTAQGNRASASAEATSAIHPARVAHGHRSQRPSVSRNKRPSRYYQDCPIPFLDRLATSYRSSHTGTDTRAHHPTAADQPLPACTAGGRDGGAAPGGADGGTDRHTLRLPPHHGGAASQAGRGDAAHRPSRPCLPRAGAAGLR